MSTSTPPPGKRDELAGGGGVAAPLIAVADSPVACTSSPTSPFTSVDFPTPDAPMSATVRSGVGERAQAIEPGAGHRARDDDLDVGRGRAARARPRVRRSARSTRSAFDKHDHRIGAALEREHELALEPAEFGPFSTTA